MKKLTLIGFIVLVALAGMLFWQHFKHPSDAQLRRMLHGTWTMNSNGKHQMVIAADDSFVTTVFDTKGSLLFKMEGVVAITNGMMVGRVTKSSNTNARVPYVSSMRIYRISDTELVVGADGAKNVFHRSNL